MTPVGFGFREVIVDEPFGGKWMDVDMNLGGGHGTGTFQGTKFCDRAGGFSYRASLSPRQIMQNRFIYWRVLNDTLELIEVSMDYNLEDNQIRYIFRDSPIVSPITIQEDDEHITIMVVTVTSVNRFTFHHPNKLFIEDGYLIKNRQPSIFHQVLNKPLMTLKSFNLFDQAINLPVPTTAAAYVMPYKTGHIFALAYESGSVTVCKISNQDTLVLYDLRQANLFARLLSYTPSILRGSSHSPDAAVGLRFFIAKLDRNKRTLFLCTLSMNGHIRLYMCNNLQSLNDWVVVSDVLVDRRFALDGYTDCNMLLRMNCESDHASPNLPKCVIFVPMEGFRIFDIVRTEVNTSTNPLQLISTEVIDFRETIMDLSVTNDFLFILVSNPDEETDWEVKSYNLNDTSNPRFNLALLEVQPYPDINVFPSSFEPKEFYFDLVFNKSSFSAHTIYNALSTFDSAGTLPKYENDWEGTKEFAVAVIEHEIRLDMNAMNEWTSDEDYYEIVLKYWMGFYNSCVEYHINTVKPLGIFFERNTQMACVVKKSRISFLRPTDFFETLYYFPHCVSLGPESDERSAHIGMLLKYFEILDFIDSTTDEGLKNKVNKRLIENRTRVSAACAEIGNLLTEADPYSAVMERRHFMPMLMTKLRELGGDGDTVMQLILTLMSSWDREADLLDVNIADEFMDEKSSSVTEYFMGSRYGSNITYRILKQLLNHRFIILRNTLILQSLITNFCARQDDGDGVRMVPSLKDQKEAQELIIHCFALQGIMEKNAEIVPDTLTEKCLKVANVLNTFTVDHAIQTKLREFRPLKLVELFCHSSTGGLAIRSRVNQFRNSKIVAYADAAGKAIWASEDSPDHPFEEFLISSCQHSALDQYSTNITPDINGKSTTKKFYHGLADLFSGDFDLALGRFRSISFPEIQDDAYFCGKILIQPQIQENQTLHPIMFYQKVINLFQIFGHTISIQVLAEEALKTTTEDRWIRVMSVLGFKSALIIGDYVSAYRFICQMPHEVRRIGKEKTSSLRTFLGQILERADIDVLMNLDADDEFFKLTSTKEEIDKILATQARLSNPLTEDGVYQMIYLYHLTQEDYRKAASAMLERVVQIGAKGKGPKDLRAQKESYLDILSCLSLIEDPLLAYAKRNDDLDFFTLVRNMPEIEGGSGNEDSIYHDIVVPPKNFVDTPAATQIRTYDDMKRECELCVCLLLLEETMPSDPIRFMDGPRRAVEAVDHLVMAYRFDNAIKLAGMWGISYIPIIRAFANVCVNLNYDIRPKDGDASEYVRHLDTSELKSSGNNIVELAFNILQAYIRKLEKPMHTELHEAVALEMLSYNINLPRWLVDSYKLKDASQLINCYLRYGEWEDATNLAVDVIDAALGRRSDKEFDPSIQTVTAYTVDPVIPYTAIDSLAIELKARLMKEPQCDQLFKTLKRRCDDYVIRVNETRQERVAMFT